MFLTSLPVSKSCKEKCNSARVRTAFCFPKGLEVSLYNFGFEIVSAGELLVADGQFAGGGRISRHA